MVKLLSITNHIYTIPLLVKLWTIIDQVTLTFLTLWFHVIYMANNLISKVKRSENISETIMNTLTWNWTWSLKFPFDFCHKLCSLLIIFDIGWLTQYFCISRHKLHTEELKDMPYFFCLNQINDTYEICVTY